MTYALFNRLEDLVSDWGFGLAVLEEQPGKSRALLLDGAGQPLGVLAKTESKFWFKSWYTDRVYSFPSFPLMMVWIRLKLQKSA